MEFKVHTGQHPPRPTVEEGCLLLPKPSHELVSAENRTKGRVGARPSRVISFDDYHKTWCGIATSKATESHRRPLLEDPDLTQQYSKWKEKDLRCSEEWKFKFAATRSRCARERRAPAIASPAGKRTHACPTPEELPTGSQPDAGHDPGTGDPEDDWSDEDLGYNHYKHNSWEDEVDDLVSWANALDSDTLED